MDHQGSPSSPQLFHPGSLRQSYDLDRFRSLTAGTGFYAVCHSPVPLDAQSLFSRLDQALLQAGLWERGWKEYKREPGRPLPSRSGAGLVSKSCPTLCNPMDCSPPGSSVLGIFQARILEWVCHFLLQGIFPSQGSNPYLLHGQVDSLPLSHLGRPNALH